MVRSILKTEPGVCYWCGRQMETVLHHCIPNNPRRKLCTQDGLVVFMCVEDHQTLHESPNEAIDLTIKQDAQLAWERTYGNRESFIKRYGRSYL